VFVCMDEMKLYVLLLGVTSTQLITSWVQSRLITCIRFSKHVQFQIHPALNFLAVPHWLTVKFQYSVIGTKVKILSMLSLLAATYLTLFPMS
jgi:hypothetical protein